MIMELKSSPKIFENYKCDYPQNTIKRYDEICRFLKEEIAARLPTGKTFFGFLKTYFIY